MVSCGGVRRGCRGGRVRGTARVGTVSFGASMSRKQSRTATKENSYSRKKERKGIVWTETNEVNAML